ncbi:hypothetical protein FGO68_gene7292 [Halteria grandinella]|uniref:Uncharacterized protein n=1 Tax=Halteria grandinella TaxID=5974 RepID=A0A8J8NU09_HALGN|nr:hypothetical protein FGO68_gene7292 [Halteria grandinella]
MDHFQETIELSKISIKSDYIQHQFFTNLTNFNLRTLKLNLSPGSPALDLTLLPVTLVKLKIEMTPILPYKLVGTMSYSVQNLKLKCGKVSWLNKALQLIPLPAKVLTLDIVKASLSQVKQLLELPIFTKPVLRPMIKICKLFFEHSDFALVDYFHQKCIYLRFVELHEDLLKQPTLIERNAALPQQNLKIRQIVIADQSISEEQVNAVAMHPCKIKNLRYLPINQEMHLGVEALQIVGINQKDFSYLAQLSHQCKNLDIICIYNIYKGENYDKISDKDILKVREIASYQDISTSIVLMKLLERSKDYINNIKLSVLSQNGFAQSLQGSKSVKRVECIDRFANARYSQLSLALMFQSFPYLKELIVHIEYFIDFSNFVQTLPNIQNLAFTVAVPLSDRDQLLKLCPNLKTFKVPRFDNEEFIYYSIAYPRVTFQTQSFEFEEQVASIAYYALHPEQLRSKEGCSQEIVKETEKQFNLISKKIVEKHQRNDILIVIRSYLKHVELLLQ